MRERVNEQVRNKEDYLFKKRIFSYEIKRAIQLDQTDRIWHVSRCLPMIDLNLT